MEHYTRDTHGKHTKIDGSWRKETANPKGLGILRDFKRRHIEINIRKTKDEIRK